MSLTLLGWSLAAASIATSALCLAAFRGARAPWLDIDGCRSSLREIQHRRTLGKLSETDADEERLELFVRLKTSRWRLDRLAQRVPRPAIASAAAFVMILGFGAVNSFGVNRTGAAPHPAPATASTPDDELFANLKTYADTPAAQAAAHANTPERPLPDVDTMIAQLASRLESNPRDIDGWRMLGWSYLQMAQYSMAEVAFSRAVALDPQSPELKQAYEQAKAKAAEAASAVNAGADVPRPN